MSLSLRLDGLRWGDKKEETGLCPLIEENKTVTSRRAQISFSERKHSYSLRRFFGVFLPLLPQDEWGRRLWGSVTVLSWENIKCVTAEIKRRLNWWAAAFWIRREEGVVPETPSSEASQKWNEKSWTYGFALVAFGWIDKQPFTRPGEKMSLQTCWNVSGQRGGSLNLFSKDVFAPPPLADISVSL